MKNVFKKTCIAIAIIFVCATSPVFALAQTNPAPASQGTTKDFGLSGVKSSNLSLPDKEPDVFFATAIRWVLGLIGVVLVAMFVYGGVLYATSAGNDERVETGKKVITYAVIGLAIIVTAAIISEFVINALFSAPSNDPLVDQQPASSSNPSNAGSAGAVAGGSSIPQSPANNNSGASSNGNSGSGDRLPTTNTVGLSGICGNELAVCAVPYACNKDPNSSQKYCLIEKGSDCNTKTTSLKGDHGCTFGTTCVKDKNPVDDFGLPDPSKNDGTCR